MWGEYDQSTLYEIHKEFFEKCIKRELFDNIPYILPLESIYCFVFIHTYTHVHTHSLVSSKDLLVDRIWICF